MSDAKTEVTEELKRAEEYAVTPADLEKLLAHLLSPFDASGTPKEQASTMIWGAMGIGKTEIVRQLGQKWRSRIVALHLPQMDPTDIKGIPVKISEGGVDKVKWVPSSYLPQEIEIIIESDMLNEKGQYNNVLEFRNELVSAEDVSVTVLDREGNTVFRYNDQMSGGVSNANATANVDMVHKKVTLQMKPGKDENLVGYRILLTDKAILFLDELSASVPQVQNAALQLVLDKRVGEYDVPANTPIVAAGNRESDAAFVHPMSAPLSNRFCHLRLMISLDDWINWALPRRVHPHIIGYMKWKGSTSLLAFDPDKMEEGDGGFPTPRSWFKLSRQMTRELKKEIMDAMITGFIGRAMGSDFIAYRTICELLPSTDAILQGQLTDFDEDLDVGQRYGLATALCYKLFDYHEKYYDPDIGTDEMDKQAKEWKIAAQSFCQFIDKNLGAEMTVLCIHIVSRVLGISFIKFKNSDGKNAFAEFAKKYREILRKVI